MPIADGIKRVLIPLLLLTILGVALAPLSTGTLPTTAEDADFAAFLEPRLEALVTSATEVETLVRGHSRNVLALRGESRRIETLVNDIDSYLEAHPVPSWADSVVSHYRKGTGLILSSIDAAYQALRTFDFSAMPDMIPVFTEGTSELETALRSLQDATGSGSSYTGDGVA